ncbi:MAG: CopG family transcriptional regulator [Bacillota bacterium]
MGSAKRISICIPVSLLREVDFMARADETSRDQFITDATEAYIEARKRRSLRESLRSGYEKMASLNLDIAEACIDAENEGCELLMQDLAGGGDVGDI